MDPLEDTEFLFTVAEVGVALAGFAGLVSVVAQRRGQTRAGAAEAHRLRMMLVYCLLATGFAFVPYVLLRTEMDPVGAWRLSSAGLGVIWAGYFARAFPRASRFVEGSPLRVRLLAYVGIAISAFGLATLAASALGAFGRHTAVAYMVALLALLLAAVRLFVRTFVSMLNPIDTHDITGE